MGFDVAEGEAGGLGGEGLIFFELEIAGVQFEFALEMEGQDGGGFDLQAGVGEGGEGEEEFDGGCGRRGRVLWDGGGREQGGLESRGPVDVGVRGG